MPLAVYGRFVAGPGIALTGYHRRIGLHTIVDGQLQRHGVLASLCIGEDEGIVAAGGIWMVRYAARYTSYRQPPSYRSSHHC